MWCQGSFPFRTFFLWSHLVSKHLMSTYDMPGISHSQTTCRAVCSLLLGHGLRHVGGLKKLLFCENQLGCLWSWHLRGPVKLSHWAAMSQDAAGADQSLANHMHMDIVDSVASCHMASLEGRQPHNLAAPFFKQLTQEVVSYCLRQKLLSFFVA